MKNLRIRTLFMICFAAMLLSVIYIWGSVLPKELYNVNFKMRDAAPSLSHIFGCDWMGRDMFYRTLNGMTISIRIGLFASVISCIIAIIFGIGAATLGEKVDQFILWLIDLFQGMPHMIFLIFISILLGKGVRGILIGVALIHWPRLARVVRAEIFSIKKRPYILISEKLGKGKMYIATHHIFRHIIPQFIIELILLFPHAILHESAITFLGFGIPPDRPAIGVILSESMRYLTQGSWWLSVFPGLILLSIVLLFDTIGNNLSKLIQAKSAQL